MNRVDTIKEVWKKLESECTEGLIKRALDIPSCLKVFCTYRFPEKHRGIAFSFHQDVKLDISCFQDLSELKITLLNDASFLKSKLLIIQLNNRDSRVNDIFASICANIVNSVIDATSEKEGVRLVTIQMRRWKDLFSKRRNQKLSAQEQQGLFGELFFLRKLLLSPIDKASSTGFWVGPEMAPKDFQGDMWAVEVKTTVAHSHSNIAINGELQLDESDTDKLYLYHLVVEALPQDGETLPEIIASIRQMLKGDIKAASLFESKLMLAGYFDLDEDSYKECHYHIRKEQYFQVRDEFPRIKKDELKMGVSEVKYNISLNYSSETENSDVAFYERDLGTKKQQKINGYAIADNYETVDLFISIYEGTDEAVTITKRDIDNAATRITNFFRNAIYSDFGNEIEESSAIFEFTNTLGTYKELRDSLVRINAFILTNGAYKGDIPQSKEISGYKIYYRIVDVNYLYQISEQYHALIMRHTFLYFLGNVYRACMRDTEDDF